MTDTIKSKNITSFFASITGQIYIKTIMKDLGSTVEKEDNNVAFRC